MAASPRQVMLLRFIIPVILINCAPVSLNPFFLSESFDFQSNSLLDPPGVESDNDPRLFSLTTTKPIGCPSVFSHLPNPNLTCAADLDCRNGQLCCPFGRFRFCLTGLRRTKDVRHKPLLGVPRHCPTTEPLQEILPVKNCTRDTECEPRICCPDGTFSYCRTAVPRLQPRTSQAVRMIRNLVSFLQCSPPPPPSLDLFPKTCKYSLDCFPNICCQEQGKKVCRPAKRSILRFLAAFTK